MNGGGPVTILFLAHAGPDLGLFAQLIHPEDRPRFFAAGAAGAFRPAGFTCRVALPSGPWLWTRWILATGPGQLQGALQLILERYGDQLAQCRKATSAGILVGGLGHDFANRVAAITACAASLARTGLAADQQDTVASILQAAEHAGDLARQLLDFAGKDQEPRKGIHCLNTLAREAAALLAHLHARGVRMETEFCPGSLEALVEPGQIQLLLLNLGLNALDALAGPGTVALRTGRLRLGPRESAGLDCLPGAYAFLEVEDSGCGIAPEHLDRIYDPGFTTKPAGLGAGLGLALAQAIVKGHDGVLQCRSEPGRGTRIRALLPEAGPARVAERELEKT